VEYEGVLVCLRSISVDYLQGWQVGEPRLLADVTDELANIEK
jgi:EAL domain-containing protein (putative c-di-GMP-specific phosphodiesterase class I)